MEWELQIVKLSATKCSYIAILWLSLVSFGAITLFVASKLVFIVVSVYFLTTQSGNFWIHPCMWSSCFSDMSIGHSSPLEWVVFDSDNKLKCIWIIILHLQKLVEVHKDISAVKLMKWIQCSTMFICCSKLLELLLTWVLRALCLKGMQPKHGTDHTFV